VDVLFVDQPTDELFPQSDWCLGYRYMISSLRAAGYEAEILYPDAVYDGTVRSRMVDEILARQAAIVGFTTYDAHLDALIELIAELRRAGVRSHIVVGGMCASAIAPDLLRAVSGLDSVVVGEGEHSIVELAGWVQEGRPGTDPPPGVWARRGAEIVSGGPRTFVDDLDGFPPPAVDDLRRPAPNSPMRHVNGCAPVVASRGCYGRCTFCSVQQFYRSCPGRLWRGRDPAAVVDDVETAIGLGFDRVTFVDENFIGPGRAGRRHAHDLAAELRHRNLDVRFNFGCRPNDVDESVIADLQEAGLAGVSVGIESMAAATLELFDKKTTPAVNEAALQILERLGVPTEITFIYLHPLSTLDEIRTNAAFVERVRCSPTAYFNNGQPFTEFIPFFGTAMTDRLVQQGLVRRDLRGYDIAYADERVGAIAARITGFPAELVGRLRYALPATGSERLDAIQASLARYQEYLNMAFLPAIVLQLCDAFALPHRRRGTEVDRVDAALVAETDRIHALIEAFTAHARKDVECVSRWC
jgi:5-methoxy-6-methylbenzimidazole methyltransferase